MKKFFITANSAILMALFFLSDIYPLTLTKGSYTMSGEMADIALKEEVISIDGYKRRETFSFNLGLPSNSSIGFDFSLLQDRFSGRSSSVAGDILFNFWHFSGNYLNGMIDTGISITARIPTGPDAYTEQRYRNLALGNNELKIMPVVGLKFSESDILFLNIGYTFREAHGENFYRGFNLDPGKKETYRSVIGLNPFYDGAFLDKDNLKNDYFSIAAGFVTSRLQPLILFAEAYFSSRLYIGDIPSDDIAIEGAGVNPILLSAGVKYMFTSASYVQGSFVKNIPPKEHYINNILEITLNIFF